MTAGTVCWIAPCHAQNVVAKTGGLTVSAAEQTPAALVTPILSVSRAGNRIVGVGDHGAILLSDDNGVSFRQAKSVPVQSALTAVSFANQRTGWAVGHWGAILRTDDGGETWHRQRIDLANDQPLFSVYFKNASEGWAVGLWSLMLHTTNGGATWDEVILPPSPGRKKADNNLYDIFAGKEGQLYIASEHGLILHSADDGRTWTYSDTGYKGSFWCGVTLRSGTLVVAGLRGSIYRSGDGGVSWSAVQSDFPSSITALVQERDGTVAALGLDGVSLLSHDDGRTFSGEQRADRLALTAATETSQGSLSIFSVNGPVSQ